MKVFITGASSGIGEALAREYARRHPGVELGLVARRADRLRSLAAELTGARVRTYTLDVLDRAALHAAAADFIERTGAPDVVVANAGVSGGTASDGAADAAVFERIVRTNLVALHDTLSVFVPSMRAAGRGRLVGVASVAAARGLPGAGAYCASKAGAVAALESLRVELRGSGVSVVTISPGFIRTDMTARNRFHMPFLMDADVFAVRAVDAIGAGVAHAIVPWQMGLIAKGLRLLPDGLYDRLFSRAPRKARADP